MSSDKHIEWFYSDGLQQSGPLSESELEKLHSTGAITDQTIVWHEGLQNWTPFGEVFAEQSRSEATTRSAAIPESEICAYSKERFPRSEMLQYGDLWVASAHKDAFVQSIGEGALVGRDLEDLDEFVPDLSLSSILRQSWKIFTSQLVEIALITIVIWAPFYFLVEYFAFQSPEVIPDDEFGWTGIAQASRWERIFETWIGSIATGGIISVVASRWNGFSKISPGEIFSRGFENWARLIGTRILTGIYIIVPLLLLILPVILVDVIVFQILWGTILGCAFLYFYVRIAFGEYIAVINEEGGSPAISESWNITKRRFWRIVGYQLVIFTPILIAIFVSSVIYLIPFTDNFVVSALHSLVIGVLFSFGFVACTVFAIHLQNCPVKVEDLAVPASTTGGTERIGQ